MWNTFSNLAQKAKAVAADLEGQLDKSVGLEASATTEAAATSSSKFGMQDDMDPNLDDDDDNAWNDDFPLDDDLDISSSSKKVNSNDRMNDDDNKPLAVSEEALAPISNEIPEESIPQSSPEENLPDTTPSTTSVVANDLTGSLSAEIQMPTTAMTTTPAESETITTKTPSEPPVAEVESSPIVDRGGGMQEDKAEENATTNDTAPSDIPLSSTEPEPATPSLIEETVSPNNEVESEPTSLVEESSEHPPLHDDFPTEETQASTMEESSNHTPLETQSENVMEVTNALHESSSSVPFASEPEPMVDSKPEEASVTPDQQDEFVEEKDHQAANTLASSQSNLEAQAIWQQQLADLQEQLRQREEQLMNKTQQLTSMQSLHDQETRELEQRLENTKEEAKRRLAKAKERVEAAEKRVAAVSSSSSDATAQQEELIAALRAEGEKLARKQLDMEQAVRTAKGEARELRESLELEQEARSKALEKNAKLEADLKSTKADLAAARRGESQASKLELELQSVREESERKSASILALEQQVKELKASSKDLVHQLDQARTGAALDSEREQQKLKKEHVSMLDDLETKLRTTEKEAAVREDALRHEVSELRKRWQDAVRRADSLSMDVQSSTAPLLRQLESMERTNRTRAAGWATLETKLRQELEDAIVQVEQLQKERNELKSKSQRLERQYQESTSQLETLGASHEDKTQRLQTMESRLSDMEVVHSKEQQEWQETQRLANEAVSRVRGEMAQTVVEAEERHVSQLDSLKKELLVEKEKRQQLEEQVQGLLDKATAMVIPMDNEGLGEPMTMPKAPPKKLGSGQGQAEILAGALNGIGDDDEDDTEDPQNGEAEANMSHLSTGMNGATASSSSSFAALEELQSRLKVTLVEVKTLRHSLEESEKTREQMVTELAASRQAKERLPAVEQLLQQQTNENKELSLEIQGLQDDIREVRELYRSQLNVLIEEKAAIAPEPSSPSTPKEEGNDEDATATSVEGTTAIADD